MRTLIAALVVCFALCASDAAAQCIRGSLVGPPPVLQFWVCATEAERASTTIPSGDLIVTVDSMRWWRSTGGTSSAAFTAGSPAWADVTGKPTTFAPIIGAGAADAVAGNDSRLTNARTPTTHAATHVTGGGDTIANVAAGGNAGLMTGADKTKLDAQSGTNTGDQATVSGNAGSATTLQTPRTINGVSFNGSANITVTAAGSTLTDNVPVSKLNSGTNASASTYWRGDGAWVAPAVPSFVVTVADTTNATTSYADITGLVFNVAASTRYRISCILPYDANAVTTGLGVGWVGPASPTLTRAFMTSGITTATPGSTNIVGNDTGAVTTASVATTGNVAHFEGIWSNGANAGTIQMRVKSEVAVANAIIVRTGAMCSYAVY